MACRTALIGFAVSWQLAGAASNGEGHRTAGPAVHTIPASAAATPYHINCTPMMKSRRRARADFSINGPLSKMIVFSTDNHYKK
jgi:hypothetical protein